MNTYWRRRPHLERVLSEMNPMTGSVMASKTRGKNWMMPQSRAANPRSCTNTMMNTPKAAGNIWLASMPNPKATFWPMETVGVGVEVEGSMIREV